MLNSRSTPTLVVGAYNQTGGSFLLIGTGRNGSGSTLTVTGDLSLSGGPDDKRLDHRHDDGCPQCGGQLQPHRRPLAGNGTAGRTSTVTFNGAGTQTFTSGGTVTTRPTSS